VRIIHSVMWSNKTQLESVEIPELLISSCKLNIGKEYRVGNVRIIHSVMWSNKTQLESVEIPELLISSCKLNIGITLCKIGAANYGVFTFVILRILL